MWKIYAQKPAPIAAIVILSVISFNTRIQALETADGGLPGYFMNEGTGARALGMGRAFTAVADDASAIYWNASTRFTDGSQFGFGAELGISTQKLHVRGPMGLDTLFTYKYEIVGNGQIRE